MLRFGHWLALRITPLARCVGLSRSRVKSSFDITIIIIVLNWNICNAIALCFFLIFFFSFGAFPRKPHSRNQKLALPGWNRCQKTMDGIFVDALLHFHGIMWLSDHRDSGNVARTGHWISSRRLLLTGPTSICGNGNAYIWTLDIDNGNDDFNGYW